MGKNTGRYRPYFLTAILFIAAVFRLYQIDQPFVDDTNWRQTDNATMADNFYKGNNNILYPEISWNGPGHNYVGYEFQTVTYLAALLYRVFGQHEWVGRGICVAFALWGVFAFYKLVSRVRSAETALLSAALLAVMPGAVFFDRCFLPDPVMLSLVLTSFWLLLVYLQSARTLYLVLASLTGLLGLLTKVSGIFIAFPVLYAVIHFAKQNQAFSKAHVIRLIVAGICVIVPVVAYYRWAIHISHTYPPYYIAANQYWVWTFGLKSFLQQNYFLPALYKQLAVLWTVPLLVLAVGGLFVFPLRKKAASQQNEPETNGRAPWLFHWWVVGCGVYYALGAQGLVANPSNLNLANPVAAALAATLLMWLTSFAERRMKMPVSAVATGCFLLLIAGIGYRNRSVRYQPSGEKDYKLGLALRELSQPNDLVVTAPSVVGSTISIYYSQRRGWPFPPPHSWDKYWWDVPSPDAIALLNGLIDKGATWFGVAQAQLQQFQKNSPEFVEYLDANLDRYHRTPDFVIYRVRGKNKNPVAANHSR